MSDKSKNLPSIGESADIVQAAIDDALLQLKRDRTARIGKLLDTAADVLQSSLDDTRKPADKLRTVELAINLYNSQEENVRQDKRLELQQQQLEFEKQKASLPGGPLFQQNNLYMGGTQPPPVVVSSEEQESLLLRKRAQEAILSQYLAKPEPNSVEIDIEKSEEDT